MGRGHPRPRNIPLAGCPGGRESDRRAHESHGHLPDAVLCGRGNIAPGQVGDGCTVQVIVSCACQACCLILTVPLRLPSVPVAGTARLLSRVRLAHAPVGLSSWVGRDLHSFLWPSQQLDPDANVC